MPGYSPIRQGRQMKTKRILASAAISKIFLLVLRIPVGQRHFANINENEERHTLSVVSYNRSTVRRLLFNLCDPIPRLSTKKEQRHVSYVD